MITKSKFLNYSVTFRRTQSSNDDDSPTTVQYKILPFNIIAIACGNFSALYGLYLCFTVAKMSTILLAICIGILGLLGVMAGVHRLWTHKSYKATLPLQILLMVMYSFAYQFTAINWIRDHRMHHKYSDTDADPYNSRRGFFFSHVGWLLVKKHPEVLRLAHTIDTSDLYNNPVLVFQKKYRFLFLTVLCFGLPTLIPVYFWQESLIVASHITMLRYVVTSHNVSFINSLAHAWGTKPYDKGINPTQNWFLSILSLGEGFHNYHHVFPWDYRAAEFGNNWLNPASLFIDACAWAGWATELKSAAPQMVHSRARRTGDGSDLWGNTNTHTDKRESQVNLINGNSKILNGY